MSQPYFKVTLTDAYIVDYRDTGDGINGAAPGDEHERISLTYYKIALTTEPVSKTIAEDYWYAVN
jgi:type VI protein secretion system component Hcp